MCSADKCMLCRLVATKATRYVFLYTDVDECAQNTDGCEQMCTDTAGSYQCSCRDGYRLGRDGRRCEGECTYITSFKIVCRQVRNPYQ